MGTPVKLSPEGGPSASSKGQLRRNGSLSLSIVRSLSPSSRWVLDPRTVGFVAHWDMAMTLALFYVALVTPVEVAFIPSPEEKWSNPIFLVNRLLDVIFITDMFLQFRLAYKEE